MINSLTYPNTTTLSSAKLKISGKYKVVVDLNNNIYLDDYNNNRVKVDLNRNFLVQVSNFLKTNAVLIKNDLLDYGFKLDKNTLKLHTPLYLSDANELPGYCCINQLISDEFDAGVKLIKFIDFKDVRLYNILNDITFDNNYNHMVFNNFEDSYIELFGYDIINECYTSVKIDSQEYQTKLTNSETLLNYIGDLYVRYNLINPRFINLEFEFENLNFQTFNLYNFTGFLSYNNISTNFDITNDVIIDTYNLQQKTEPTLTKHLKLIWEDNFQPIIDSDSYIELTFNNINVNDELIFNDINGIEVFKYIVKTEDIDITLNATLQKIRRNIDYDSNFLVEHKNNKITLTSIYTFDIFVSVPNYVTLNTNGNFIEKNENDISIKIDIPIENILIKIGDVEYPVIFKYREYDNFYYRIDVNNLSTNLINKKLIIFEKIEPTYYLLNAIQHATYGIRLKYNENSNRESYIESLKSKFPTQIDTIEIFANSSLKFSEQIPFVDVDTNKSKSEININELVNVSGTSSYCLPNVLNYDKQFYIEDVNLNYHWFLINSETPNYLIDSASNRFISDDKFYVNNKPSLDNVIIKSVLKIKDKNSIYSECVFLGIRYLLDYRFNNYEFAVIHLPNENKADNEIDKYKFHVNHEKRQVILLLNKYLLFVDLIRGGDIDTNPILDLSFYYTIDRLYTSNSEHLQFITRRNGLLLGDETIPVQFKILNNTNDWKYFDPIENKWFICFKRNDEINTINLQNYLPVAGDTEFYHYNILSEVGTIIAVKFKFINIVDLTDNYVWCENLIVSYYESENNYYNINKTDDVKWEKIDDLNIQSDLNQIQVKAKINGSDEINIVFDPTKELNLKVDYFECNLNNIEDIFKFPESNLSDNIIIDKLRNGINLPDNNNKYLSKKITMFHRNQLWFLNKHLISTQSYFKFENFNEIRKNINDLTVDRLKLYSDVNLIKSNTNDEFELIVHKKDIGLSYWDDKIVKIFRNRGLYRPSFLIKDLKHSELFCYSLDINLEITITNSVFNYIELLDKFLFDNNSNFSSVELLSIYYKLNKITNDNLKIDYNFSENNKNNLIVSDEYLNKKLILNFVKK